MALLLGPRPDACAGLARAQAGPYVAGLSTPGCPRLRQHSAHTDPKTLARKREKCEIGYASPIPYSPSVGAHARDTDRKAAWSSLSIQNAKNAVTEAHFLKSGGRARDMRSYSPMPMHGV